MDRKRSYRIVFFSLILIAFFCSCSSTRETAANRKANKNITQKEYKQADSLWVKVCEINEVPESFSASFNIHLKADASSKESMRFSGQIRIKQDSIIWLSLGIFGIEGYRAWLSGDTICVLDRLKKECHIYTISTLLEKYPNLAPYMKIGVPWMESFFTGTLPKGFSTEKAEMLNSTDKSLVAYGISHNGTRMEMFFDKQSLVLRKALVPYNTKESMEVGYTQPLSWLVKVMLGSVQSEAKCEYSKVKINEDGIIPMNIPQNYKIYVY